MKNLLILSFLFISFNIIAKNFDHSHKRWTEFLSKHVKDFKTYSTVNYKAIKESPKKIEAYLQAISSVSKDQYNQFTEKEKLAFLINTYNAYTVKFIVDNYPVKSIKDLGSFLTSPWKKENFLLFGKKVSLDYIEHGLIRKNFAEARVHFAVNCASIGCPKLANYAFTAKDLSSQLNIASAAFLSDKSRNYYDSKKGYFYLSKIFDWYGKDFKKRYGSVKNFVLPFLVKDKNLVEDLRQKKVKIKYTDYDWDLNKTN